MVIGWRKTSSGVSDRARLLASVSRSFSLSLRLLPEAVAPAISLAYLLARASDTVADAASTSSDVRLHCLRSLPERWEPPVNLNLATAAEGLLISHVPTLLIEVERSPDREEILCVWRRILEGQILDLTRFGSPAAPALDGEELDRYTYLVAGCVGEFWTKICLQHIRAYSRLSAEELLPLACAFGRGLQLVNILRDRHADATLGRVYVAPLRFDAELAHAREHLQAARRYIQSIRRGRLRAACALPYLLGTQTLDLVEANPEAARVKVSRPVVYRSLLQSFLV